MNVATSHSFATGEVVITLTIPAGEDVHLAAAHAANIVESVLRAARADPERTAITE